MKIAVFHYHLLPGGVTTVIRYSAAAAAAYIDGIEEILLVAGDREHADSVYTTLSESIDSCRKCRVSYAVLQEIGYTDHRKAETLDLSKLKRELVRRFGGYFWWIHNYHIGKNPIFTRAVLESAQEHPEQPILFHIHDFPECARYGNLEFLRRYHSDTLYPTGNNLFYGVINSRDHRLLIDAGLPESNVFYLPNPKPPEQAKELSTPQQKEVDRAYAGIGSYIPGAPVLLYPVRSIRRKNVLEAGLFSKLTDTPVNLFTTLPGVSDHEKGYSELVEKAYRNKLIPGVFGAGIPSMEEKTGITFHDLIGFSRSLVSSSIQEGFGYLFIQAISWGKNLFAKNLETLTDFTPFFSSNSHYVYNALSVPLEEREMSDAEALYHAYLSGLVQFLGEEGVESLKTAINRMLGQNPVDFSFLPPNMQYKVLLRCTDAGYAGECGRINKNELERFDRLLHSPDRASEIDLDAQFGFEAYARRLGEVFSASTAFPAPSAAPRTGSSSAPGSQSQSAGRLERDRKIQQFFLKPEYIRLLYAPYPP